MIVKTSKSFNPSKIVFNEKKQIRKKFIKEVEKIGVFKASKITGLSPSFICKILNREFFVSPKTLRILKQRGI